VRRVSTVQKAMKLRREHRVVIGIEKDGKGSTLVQGNDDLRSTSYYFTNVLKKNLIFY